MSRRSCSPWASHPVILPLPKILAKNLKNFFEFVDGTPQALRCIREVPIGDLNEVLKALPRGRHIILEVRTNLAEKRACFGLDSFEQLLVLLHRILDLAPRLL